MKCRLNCKRLKFLKIKKNFLTFRYLPLTWPCIIHFGGIPIFYSEGETHHPSPLPPPRRMREEGVEEFHYFYPTLPLKVERVCDIHLLCCRRLKVTCNRFPTWTGSALGRFSRFSFPFSSIFWTAVPPLQIPSKVSIAKCVYIAHRAQGTNDLEYRNPAVSCPILPLQ